jgi:hypothetical protein
MAKKALLTQKNKNILAAVAGGAFVVVFVYQFFLSGPDSTTTTTPVRPPAATTSTSGNSSSGQSAGQKSASAHPQPTPALSSDAARQAMLQQLLADTSALDFTPLKQIKEGGETPRGNMFEVHKEPPPSPTPTPAPPPIAVRYVEPQTAIAGTPKPITIKVTGAGFPPDPQIIFGGAPRQTTRVSDTVVSIQISPADYSAARSVSIEVKSKSSPTELYSNQIPFIIQPSPAPPFKNVGRIGDMAVIEIGDAANKQYLRLRRNQVIEGVWRIDAITETGLDVTDTRYDIKKRVPLEEKK